MVLWARWLTRERMRAQRHTTYQCSWDCKSSWLTRYVVVVAAPVRCTSLAGRRFQAVWLPGRVVRFQGCVWATRVLLYLLYLAKEHRGNN